MSHYVIEVPLEEPMPFDIYGPTAKDRRACVRHFYGSWFDDNRLKLSRDYMVTFANKIDRMFIGTERVAKIEIFDPTKAMLFKLTWGGAV